MAVAGRALLSGCGRGAAGAQQGGPPGGMTPQVTVVTLKSAAGHADARVAGTHQRVPGGRSASAGQRHREAAAVRRGRAGQGRPAAVRDRRCHLSRAARTARRPRCRRREATRSGRQAHGRARPGADQDRCRQRAGQRQCDRRPMARHRRMWRPARPRLPMPRSISQYAHIVAPISGRIGKSTRDVRRAGHRRSGRGDGDRSSSSIRSTSTSTRPSSEWLQLKQEIDSGRVQVRRGGCAGEDRASRTGAPTGSRASCSSPTSRWIRPRAISCCAPSSPIPMTSCCPACTCARQLGRGRAAAAGCWRRSRASRATRRAVPPRWWSTRTARSSRATSRYRARSAINGWSTTVSPAGDRVIVEGLQKVQPGMPVQAVEAPPAPAIGGPLPASAAGSSGGGAGSKDSTGH